VYSNTKINNATPKTQRQTHGPTGLCELLLLTVPIEEVARCQYETVQIIFLLNLLGSAYSFARETRRPASWACRATVAHTSQQRHTERQVQTRFLRKRLWKRLRKRIREWQR